MMPTWWWRSSGSDRKGGAEDTIRRAASHSFPSVPRRPAPGTLPSSGAGYCRSKPAEIHSPEAMSATL